MTGRISILPEIGPVDIDRALFTYQGKWLGMERMHVQIDGREAQIRGELATHIYDALRDIESPRLMELC